MKLPESVLTKNQKKVFVRSLSYYGKPATITAEVRHDDECGNGHNSFSITGEIRLKDKRRKDCETCGCIHDDIEKYFPQLAKYIKWHLTSTDGPMHYIENSLYWLGKRGYCDGKDNSPPKFDYFKSTAVWPDAPEEMLTWDEKKITDTLTARLENLMAEFKKDVKELGLVY